jgi:hypothetical protein
MADGRALDDGVRGGHLDGVREGHDDDGDGRARRCPGGIWREAPGHLAGGWRLLSRPWGL